MDRRGLIRGALAALGALAAGLGWRRAQGAVEGRIEHGGSCAPGASPRQGSGVRPGRGGSSCPAAGDRSVQLLGPGWDAPAGRRLDACGSMELWHPGMEAWGARRPKVRLIEQDGALYLSVANADEFTVHALRDFAQDIEDFLREQAGRA